MIDTFLKRLIVILSVTVVLVLPLVTPIADPWLINRFMNQLDEHPHSYREWMMQNVPGPRLIIESGSNSIFGINGEMLAEYFEVNPMVLAVTHGHPLAPRVRRLVAHAQPGDVILLPFEWHLYTREEPTTGWVWDTLSYTHSIDMARYLTNQELRTGVSNIRERKNLLTFSTHNKPNWTQRKMRFEAMWLDGDHGTFALDPPSKQPSTTFNIFSPTMPKGHPFSYHSFLTLGQPFLLLLAELSAFVQDNPDITILFTYPTMAQEQEWLDDPLFYANRQAFLNLLLPVLTDHGFTMIGSVDDSFFGLEAYADTEYHITAPYRDIRTERLIEHLKPYLKERISDD